MAKYELKTKVNDDSVDSFLDSIEDEQKRNDSKEIQKMMQDATKTKGKMWGKAIVGFGEWEYKDSSGKTHEWFKIGFSPRKQNLTLYILTDDVKEQKQLLPKLGNHTTGKSCLYIKRLDDIDRAVLKDLIEKTAKA